MRIAWWIPKAAIRTRTCNIYCLSGAAKFTRSRFSVSFIRLLPVLFLFWTVQDLQKVHFLLLSACVVAGPTGTFLQAMWCGSLSSEVWSVGHFTLSSSVTVLNESRSQSQSVISVMGPVIVAGLQLRKILQGWNGCGSIDGCVLEHVTNQIHGKCRGVEWTTR
jgi:hypothetical protein